MDTNSTLLSNTTRPSSNALLIVQYVLFLAIFVINVIGNILVCLVIHNTTSMRNTRNYLIVNLAVADLTVALVCIPFDVALKAQTDPWPFGAFLCRIIWPAMTLVTQCSAATLAAISLDRFRAVIYPTKPRLSRRQTCCIIGTTWLVSLVLVLPYVLVLNFDGKECNEKWPAEDYRRAYTVCLFVFQYCLPLTVIAFAYTGVAIKIHHQANRIAKYKKECYSSENKSKREQERCLMLEEVSAFGNDNSVSSPVKVTKNLVSKPLKDLPSSYGTNPNRELTRMTTHQEQKRLERNTKIIKMLVSVVLTYAICLLPNQVVWMWVDFGTGSKYQYFNELLTFCNIMVYINSSTNPILYAGMNEEFRKGFVRILRCNTRTSQGKSFV